jgi:hypothetical protein
MIPLAMMAAGKIIQGMMQYKSLMEQASNMNNSAVNDLMQAHEIRYRSDINKKAFEKQTQQLIGEQQGAYAGAGVDVSGGAPLDIMTETVGTMIERLNLMERETAYSVMVKEQEAASKFKQARQTAKSAPWSIVGGAVGAGGAIAGAT